MVKFSPSTVFRTVKTFTSNHSPEILTAIGIVGMIGTVVVAVKETPKAIQLLEEKKNETGCEKLPPVEVVKTTWKCYIPAAVTCVASTACLIKGSSISLRRNAALVTAYNLSKTALDEYKEKVIETVGEKKEQDIVDRVAKAKLEKDPVQNHEVIVTERGNTLCYDGMFGRYFRSDMETIRGAIRDINYDLVASSAMYASLNDFYSKIGLKPIDIGDELGWTIDDRGLDVHFSSQLAEDGTPCLVMHYEVAPKYGYNKLF
jgi:hypothetical protein